MKSLDDAPGLPAHLMGRLQVLTAKLSGVVEPAETARMTVAHVMDALGADAGVVFSISPDGAFLRVTHACGYPDEAVGPWTQFPLSLPVPATDAFRTGRPVLVQSRRELQERYPLLASTPGVLELGAWAAVPLSADEACLGVFGLSFLDEREFEGEALGFLLVVADHCAQALHRAMLAERERRSTTRLRALAEASRVFSAVSPDVQSVLREVADQVVTNLGPNCSIALLSADGNWLDAAVIRDVDPVAEERHRAIAKTLRVRRGEGLTGAVLENGRSLLIPIVAPNELGSRTVPEARERVEALQVRSLLIAPLQTSSRRIGTISTSRCDDCEPFTEDDRTLLEDLADRAALAVENARLHEAEREARARAEAADRRKDEFLAMLGHELRNPLSPILSALQVMRIRAPEAAVKQRTIIERQVTHLVRLVDDLLDVSRITQGKVVLRKHALSIADVTARAAEMVGPLLDERRQRLAISIAPGLTVDGDDERLAQVLANLLTNAAKYTEPGGAIAVTASREGRQAIVRVRDSGIGIPRELLPDLFEAFVQGARSIDRSQGGLGIGLAIVRSLVELHGGTVTAESEGAGRGSEFVIRLPAVDVVYGPEPGGDKGLAVHEANRAGGRVLVVDDNRDAAEGLGDLLSDLGYVTRISYDGPSALAAAPEFTPHVALVDIGLPVMDGYEVARRLRMLPGLGGLRLVAVTGYGQPSDRERSTAAGFDEHLVKPVDHAIIEPVLERLLSRAASPST
jgi:signal transduction histidine kinase/CheY-like chemotaxis protein